MRQQLESIGQSLDNLARFGKDSRFTAAKRVMDILDIQIVDGVMVVDTRDSGELHLFPLTHDGRKLYSSDKADYALSFGKGEKFTTLMSVTGTGDLRTANWAKAVKGAVQAFRQHEAQFLKDAAKDPAWNGGGVTYKPAFVSISNFGWTLHGLKDQYVIS